MNSEQVRALGWIVAINVIALGLCFASQVRDPGIVLFAFASSVVMSFPAVLLGTKLTATEGQPVAVAALFALGGSMLIWTIAGCVILALLRNH
jgi:hypothetical protein